MEFSPQFKAWFKDSKVVNANGSPLPCYHGTKSEFDIFDLNKAGSNNDPGTWGTGFYFSPQKRMSRGYGDKFKRVYLSLQNPLIFGDDHADLPDELNWPFNPNDPLTKEKANRLRAQIISMGYDGVMQYSNGWKYPGQIIAFYPNQIKSVTNRGNYSLTDDSIMESTQNNFGHQFKAWFGSSLVTDAEDNPLRVYHGSNRLEDISIFKSEYNNGYYFTSDPNYAVEY